MILPGIQVLRGVAALLVVVYHGAILAEKPKYFNQEIFGGIFHAGYRGVDLFFVISGFIMMHTLVQNQNMKTQSFLVNRFLRIFIPYLPAFLALTLVYFIIPSVAQGGIELNLTYYIYNLLLLPRIDLTTYVPVVAWTLTHELIFYLLFSVLIISRSKVGYTLFGLWMIICFMNFFNSNAIDGSIPLVVKPLNLAFGFGILAQIASSRISESAKSGAWIVGAAIFVGSMTIDTGLRNVSILHEMSYFIGSALMCSGIGALCFKPLEKVGNMSYSLYLIHYPVLAATFIFLPKVAGDYDVNLYMFLGGAFVIVYIASATYYFIFEKVIHKQIRTRLLGR